MKKPIAIASIGDVCIDIYPQQKKHFLGGTAFNTAFHAEKAGGKTSLFSAIGRDSYGRLFNSSSLVLQMDKNHLQTLSGETSHVDVTLDSDGAPAYSKWDLGVLGKYSLNDSDLESVKTHDIARVVLFKPMIHLFEQFCFAVLPATLKVADFAGSSEYSEGLTIIERFIPHLDIIVKSLRKEDVSDIEFLMQLSLRHKQKLFLILLGESGSIVFKNGKTFTQPAIYTRVIDTNGAGDTYVAHFLVHFMKTHNISESMMKGALAAKQTVGHFGAIPTTL